MLYGNTIVKENFMEATSIETSGEIKILVPTNK